MAALVSIENLTIRFEGIAPNAVDALNVQIQFGEFLALVGESGSGKSLTALSLLQLLSKTSGMQVSGKILFQPTDSEPINLLNLPTDEINNIRGRDIAMVFQEPMTALNPLLTCGEQIAEVLRKHKRLSHTLATQETLRWIERVQLPDPKGIYDRFPHQLSGGQKQRVMIAAALCCQPKLLICDEPTTALDVTVQQEILELIRAEQKQSGMAVLFISHDLALVSQYADRVAVLYKGSLQEIGNNPELFLRPHHPYTRALLSCRPAAHKKGTRLPLVSEFLSNESPAATASETMLPTKSGEELFLQIENLQLAYTNKRNWFKQATDSSPVIRSASFDIRKGEVLGLAGESGSGKSTLGRALLGLIKPRAGSIWYQGVDLARSPVDRWPLKRQQLQLIFQDPYSSLNPRMPIGEAIGEPLRVHGLARNQSSEKKMVQEWLERVQLDPDHYTRYPHEFSGGQRQRIVIARALALQPDFVVCDESVSALDVSIQAQVLNLLNDLRATFGFTTLFISHDLGVIRYLCHRLLVLQKGVIVEAGETESVCDHPQHPYTQNLLQSVPQLQSAK